MSLPAGLQASGYVLDIDPGNAATVHLVSGNVDSIDDQETGYNLTASSAGVRPAITSAALNGNDVLYCASGKSLNLDSGFLSACDSLNKVSLFVVMKYTATNSYVCLFDSPGRQMSVFANSNGGPGYLTYRGTGGTSGSLGGGTAFTQNAWGIVGVVVDGANVSFRVDGKSPESVATGTSFNEAMSFGDNPSTGGAAPVASYAYILGFNDSLSEYDRQRIEGWLAWRFNLQGNLDPSHPYYSSAPADYEMEADYLSYTISPQPVTMNYIGVTAYSMEAETLRYIARVRAADLEVYRRPEQTTVSFVGRYSRGRRLPLVVVTKDLPDECPQVDFYNSSSIVKSAKMPRRSGSVFGLSMLIGSEFVDDHYTAVITYDVNGVSSVHYRYFEVIGGVPSGCVVDVHSVIRSLGTGVIRHTEDGVVRLGYNPRVE